MDTFDISTVYMAILTTNLLLMIISVIICNKKILINAGYKLIAIFLILTAIRYILRSHLKKVYSFVVSDEVLKELKMFMDIYCQSVEI